ncbi:MAG TPA: AMP-binding protein [Thermoanaerobaculaceae bacterium]|nr:AMP-binding protein [Thermoanaerobaculaceae bacterium]
MSGPIPSPAAPPFYAAARTLAEYVELCLARHAGNLFLAELGGGSVTYGEARERVAELRQSLRRAGVRPGDKVALLGANSIHWALVYLAVVTYGAVAVPILAEFPPASVHNIIAASDAKVLYVAAPMLEKVAGGTFPALVRTFLLEDFKPLELGGIPDLLRQVQAKVDILRERAGQFLTEHHLPGAPQAYAPRPEDLAAIVYTSGTTGHSKGVMLTQGNIVTDVIAAVRFVAISPADRFLSLLPLAHTYECSCGFLGPMSGGSSIHYLLQKPSPSVLQRAFEAVRPTLVFAVPLIIEKIYRKKVRPKIEGRFLTRTLTRLPGVRPAVHRKAVRQLLAAFGGSLRQMGFGGAPLSPDVERFMREGGFPYFVGYGMTECAPLIAGCGLGETRPGSCGTPVAGIELRIAEADAASGVGEVQVRGPMVSPGYYKNAEATAAAFTLDGWLRTGDLGALDRDGYLHLRGRSKNLILGPSGENIYPEEIEHLLEQSPWVVESLVVKRDAGLVALILPDTEGLTRELGLRRRAEGEGKAALAAVFRALLVEVNAQLPAFSKLAAFSLVDGEFAKTPTEKIKRHLYG